MPLISVTKVLESIRSQHIVTRTLGELEIQHSGESMEPRYWVGNSVVLFKVAIRGEWRSMRCYIRKTKNLEQIYGSKFLPDELYIYTSSTRGEWIDVVLEEWIEGATLQSKIEEGVESGDTEMLTQLADNFDHLACELLNATWAHGDLTCENIIVTEQGELRLIDFDGVFLPQFAGSLSCEIGTAAFQPPSRTTSDFCRHIDDYSIALISTALRALSIEPQLFNRFRFRDGLMINPEDVARRKSRALDYIAELFLERGLSSPFRVAQLLYCSTLHIASLNEIFSCKYSTPIDNEALCISLRDSKVGYETSSGRVAIPHIFDDGVDFRGNIAVVKLVDRWFKVDRFGQIIDSI